jgi:hypothetical protein
LDIPSTAAPCGACGIAIDRSSAELDDQGRPICGSCVDRAALTEGEKRSTAAITGAAMTSAFLAAASLFVCGPYTAVPALVVGAGALVAARTAERLSPGSVATSTYLAAGFGILVGLLRVLGFAAIVFFAL